jgi:HTH-type transcriptional regulator/antitoxin HigA
MAKNATYLPSEPVIPGETLKEHIDAIGMSQTTLAKRMGRPLKTISEILHGKAQITPRTALQLERVLGITSEFWLNLENNYRIAKARAEEERQLKQEAKYVNRFPYAEMSRWGWVRDTRNKFERASELLTFLGLSSLERVPEVWEVSYRKSPKFDPSPEAIAVWLRKGEIQAREIETVPYRRKAFLSALRNIRHFSAVESENICNQMIDECAAAGVALVFTPHLKKTYVNGATRWLSPRKALIQLTIRHAYKDIMLFSFFHEAAHILLHHKSDEFLEFDDAVGGEEETEADGWARDFLIKPASWQKFTHDHDFSRQSVLRFAEKINIGPEIVVGRLQHERRIGFSHLNNLRPRLYWSKRAIDS